MDDRLSESDRPHKVEIIVCLSHDNSRVQKAVELLRHGFAKKILVTSNLTFDALIKVGVSDKYILTLDRAATSTYEEALYVSEYLSNETYRSAIIISEPIHLYRVRWSFNHLLSESVTKKIFICSEPVWAEGIWWRNSASRRYVLNELSKIIYYWTVYGLLGIKNEQQWAKKLQQWYHVMLDVFA